MRVWTGPLKMILKSPAHQRGLPFHERNSPCFWDLRFNYCCVAVLHFAISACREQGCFMFLNCSPLLLKNYLNLNKILELSGGKSSLWKQGLLEGLWQFVQVLYNLNCILWYMNRLMALFIVKPTDSKLCWRYSFRRKISAINSHFMTISCPLFLGKTPFDFCKWNKDRIIFPGIILCLVVMIARFQNRREWKVADLSPLRQQLQICSSDLSHKIQLFSDLIQQTSHFCMKSWSHCSHCEFYLAIGKAKISVCVDADSATFILDQVINVPPELN